MSQIIDVPGQGHVEFPDSMNDADIVSAIQHLTTQTPALMNPHVQAQGTAARANMTPPASVMDPRYPAYANAQRGADTMDVIGGLAGGVAGGVLKPGASLMRSMAGSVMQRAMKPLTADLLSGKAARAGQTMLDEGLKVTPGGMSTLRGMGTKQNALADQIIAGSNKTIPNDEVLSYLKEPALNASLQVNADSDLAAVKQAGDEFATNPHLVGRDQMPIQLAQQLKQGTYQKLKDKYGEMGSASTESQKALARGLKETIEQAEPSVAPVNARASELWNALNVAERRALLAGNNNVLGLTMLAHSPTYQSLMLLDRSPAAQSILAHALYRSQRVPGAIGGAVAGSAPGYLMRNEIQGQ